MMPISNRPTIPAQTVAPANEEAAPTSAGDARRDALWARLRPLAYLAPLAVNWPGGRMAF
jgi:hypothetical protein